MLEIAITSEQYKAAKSLLDSVGCEGLYFHRKKSKQLIDLSHLTDDQLVDLRDSLRGVDDAGGIVDDLETLLRAKNSSSQELGGAKCKTLIEFYNRLCILVPRLERRRIYKKSKLGFWHAFHVSAIRYSPEEKKDYYVPATVTIKGNYVESGETVEDCWQYTYANVKGKSVVQVLMADDKVFETDELNIAQDGWEKSFFSIADNIGEQYLATGKGVTNGYRGQPMSMVVDGSPSRVVVDVTDEESPDDFVTRSSRKLAESLFSINGQTGDEVAVDERDDIYLPVLPMVTVFDLKRHRRVKVHVSCLKRYEYDSGLFSKLVLPREIEDLVSLLVNSDAGGFKDVVSGKSGGATILLAGPPGTGKTLTAEVLAESERRPLYSIHCSQLGTDPDEVEGELMKCFGRANRWNAIVLLDEADVYVSERGGSLDQNAIVGVFLRTLEYQSSILFMTTNRSDSIDDAVLSRCIAKIVYRRPGCAERKRIWQILSEQNGISVRQLDEICKIEISGREIKNALKLASIRSGDREIGLNDVKNALRFVPTSCVDS